MGDGCRAGVCAFAAQVVTLRVVGRVRRGMQVSVQIAPRVLGELLHVFLLAHFLRVHRPRPPKIRVRLRRE